jgi:hypothetical protein
MGREYVLNPVRSRSLDSLKLLWEQSNLLVVGLR